MSEEKSVAIVQDGDHYTISKTVASQIIAIEKEAKRLDNMRKSIHSAILAGMEEHGIEKIVMPEITATYYGFDNEILEKIVIPEITATYVAGFDKEIFDAKTFRAENPTIYDSYVKISKVKPSVRITVKDGGE